MSTFNGIVQEFPRIRIDYFRKDPNKPPPLACFLSHVHSDHLEGLESLKSPFVYCSAITRGLLLRIEKYPHRMNFMRGVLESRRQHYKHLRFVLKVIPLKCPTEIELQPLETIQVTLFDANHCPGSVMFLIDNGKNAILYTGDIRSEPWWVNSLTRDPVLLPYSSGLKKINRIYLDTTFAIKDDIHALFPSKAQGIAELLEKVQHFPSDNVFYLSAWTLGYEEVWVALSNFLGSRVHVDAYKSGLYNLPVIDSSIENISLGTLTGFQVGNHRVPGCLTNDPTARIHSCEPSTSCHTELTKSGRVVWITPVISRSSEGHVLREPGAGGGGIDYIHQSEIEFDNINSSKEIEELFRPLVRNSADLATLMCRMKSALGTKDRKITLDGPAFDTEKETSLQVFVERLLWVRDPKDSPEKPTTTPEFRQIYFPYARHSSYQELCDLVAAFKPCDIHPCTVDEQAWDEEVSMEALFGHLCSDRLFSHDKEMRLRTQALQTSEYGRDQKPVTIGEDSQLSSFMTTNSDTQNRGAAEALETHGPALCPLTPRKEVSPVTTRPDPSRDGTWPDPDLVAIQSAFESCVGREDTVELSSVSLTDKPKEVKIAEPLTPSRGLECVPASSLANRGNSSVLEDDPNAQLQLKTRVVRVPRNGSRVAKFRSMRSEAYQAARLALETGDSTAWDDLGIGGAGHMLLGEPEEEL